MFSNFNGDPVFLEKYHGIYDLANKWELPFLVHPASAPDRPAVMDKSQKIPYQLWGYTLDTSLAVVSLIFQGVMEKFPKNDPYSRAPRRHGSLLRPQATRIPIKDTARNGASS